MPDYMVPYEALLDDAKSSSGIPGDYLREALPHLWFEAYLRMTPRSTNVMTFTHGTFDYIYNDLAGDPSARPVEVEFGVLKPDGCWWIRLLDNR